jgi:hypothetical protein
MRCRAALLLFVVTKRTEKVCREQDPKGRVATESLAPTPTRKLDLLFLSFSLSPSRAYLNKTEELGPFAVLCYTQLVIVGKLQRGEILLAYIFGLELRVVLF